MKKLGIIVVVLAALLLVAPFGIGKLAEKRLNAGLDKAMEEIPYLKIVDRTWSGGWFTSTQTVTFELSEMFMKSMGDKVLKDVFKKEAAEADAAMDAEGTVYQPTADERPVAEEADDEAAAEEEASDEAAPEVTPADIAKQVRFTMRNDVLHGPILGAAGIGLARVDSHIELNEEIRKGIEEVFGKEPAFQMRTRVGFFGGGTTVFKSEGRKLNTKNKDVDFSYDTFKLKLGYSKNFDEYDVDGGLPRVTFKEANKGSFAMTDLTIEGEGKRVLEELYDGDFAFKVQEIKYQPEGGGEPLLIQGAHYEGEAVTKSDLMNLSLRMGTGAIKNADLAKFGVDVKEIHYDFSFRKLHAPTMNKMMVGFREMYSMPLEDPSKFDEAFFKPMKDNAAELLKHDPEFGIDRVGLVTPDGEIVAKGVIKLVGATVDDFTTPGAMGLIGKLDADITVEAAQKALEKFPNGATMAGAAVDGGYAKRDGEKLVCHITFKAGELLINGKPQAIPGLGGPPPAAEEGSGEEMPPQE